MSQNHFICRRTSRVVKSIHNYMSDVKEQIEQEMKRALTDLKAPNNLKDSMQYSLLAGGKRLRPILMMASYHTFQSQSDKVLKSAVALEMIHTYSLIHDDLPAMDNDDYRRGELTNHKQFNEATAILAGDALLTHSFELVARDALLTSEEKVFILKELANASGPEEMIAGQTLDMEGENKSLNLSELEEIHLHKTGALIRFAIIAGAYLAQATKEQIHHLKDFAHYLGLIFQVQDDILDITGDPEKLGKPVGSDTENEKSTYPSLLGLDGAKQKKAAYTDKAEAALEQANATDSYLKELLHVFGQREH